MTMPTETERGWRDYSAATRRYEREYIAKGCTPRKAAEMAEKQARRRGEFVRRYT
jgi:hypothetical protein